MKNTLFYGDNLSILRDHVDDASVDLIYLDPPFNAARDFNVLFQDESGQFSDAQIRAFTDTWHWNEDAELVYEELLLKGDNLGRLVEGLRLTLNRGPMMAYLVMMAVRLVELHRVLKPTGSLYLHCDPTASHYLKTVLDAVFGPENFQNEFIWKRTSAHSDTKQGSRRAGRIHDVVLFYTKSDTWTWNEVFMPYDQEYVDDFYRHVDEDGRRFRVSDLTAAKPGGDTEYEWRVKRTLPDGPWQADLDSEYLSPKDGIEYKGIGPYKGRYWAYSRANMEAFEQDGNLFYASTGMPRLRRYLDESPGVPLQDMWVDIPPIAARAKERLGYPTQKPLALLERIIEASSNPGDVVLDPFCGCGTAVVAAQKLGRRWVGIDITHLAIALIRNRLNDSFGDDAEYEVLGEPEDLAGARALAAQNAHQFEWWALSLVRAQPARPAEPAGRGRVRRGKKGADQGFDGQITFIDDGAGRAKRVLVQVKSGKVGVSVVRDLRGAIEREGAAIGVLITLQPATPAMEQEAAAAGFYESEGWGQKYPRIQILSIEDLVAGAARVRMPPVKRAFKRAEPINRSEQQNLL